MTAPPPERRAATGGTWHEASSELGRINAETEAAAASRYILRMRTLRFLASTAALVMLAAAFLTPARPAGAQWTSQSSATTASFRGLSAVDDRVAWVSGTGGTYLWTDDGGAHWHVGTVAGATSFDFRAVHAVSLDTAFLMVAAQDTARIYRTNDRGRHWTLQYSDTSRGAFLDALAFFDARHALVLGDPVDGRFTTLRTEDGGNHWKRNDDRMPAAQPGEAAFAASGTALVVCGPRDAWIGTGGAAISRVFRTHDRGRTWDVTATPIAAGTSAAGIFSIACHSPRDAIAAGGNYAHPDPAAVTVATTHDGGRTWAASPPSLVTGYLSGVALLDAAGHDVIAVGPAGTVRSHDGGVSWQRTDTLPLNAVTRAGRRVWGVGPNGRIVAFILPAPARVLPDSR